MSFCHLHAHTMGSLLDGLGTIEEILLTAASHGHPAHAFTDHGSGSMLFRGYRLADRIAKETGSPFHLIGGIEFYFVNDRRQQPEEAAAEEETQGVSSDKPPKRMHLTVLVKNEQGFTNLMALIYHASHPTTVERRRGHPLPRIDWELLERYHEGLICLSGCVSGPVAQGILRAGISGGLSPSTRLQSIFQEDFYVEIMPSSYEKQRPVNEGCLEIADHLHIPVVATNDCHYVRKEDAETHEVLLAIQRHAKMREPPEWDGGKRWAFKDRCYWLRTRPEMEAAFAAEHPYLPASLVAETLDRTLEIAAKVTFRLPPSVPELPRVSWKRLVSGPDEETQFRQFQAERGIRLLGTPLPGCGSASEYFESLNEKCCEK